MPTTFALIAFYQYMENYGAHEWDGKGQCPEYWKFKGGHQETVKTNISVEEATNLNSDAMEAIVTTSELGLGYHNDVVQYIYQGWQLVELSNNILSQVLEAQKESYDPKDPIALTYETGLTEYQCKWALEQLPT